MLSWLSRKVLWFKRRKPTKMPLTKWHLACFWLAQSVNGIDMLLRDDGTIMVISKASCDPWTLVDGVVSKSKGGSIRSHLRINTLSNEGEKFKFKTIESWSESLAKLVINIISLSKDPDPNFDPVEGRWGVMVFTSANDDGLNVKTEILFPAFKSEEELFMRMALDGFDINDEEKDSTDA